MVLSLVCEGPTQVRRAIQGRLFRADLAIGGR
jgi:hypothetical protein